MGDPESEFERVAICIWKVRKSWPVRGKRVSMEPRADRARAHSDDERRGRRDRLA